MYMYIVYAGNTVQKNKDLPTRQTITIFPKKSKNATILSFTAVLGKATVAWIKATTIMRRWHFLRDNVSEEQLHHLTGSSAEIIPIYSNLEKAHTQTCLTL